MEVTCTTSICLPLVSRGKSLAATHPMHPVLKCLQGFLMKSTVIPPALGVLDVQ